MASSEHRASRRNGRGTGAKIVPFGHPSVLATMAVLADKDAIAAY